MGSKNYTQQLRLPQFGPDDKPTWQGDMNSAFAAIDAANVDCLAKIGELQSQILALQSKVQ